jgi:hypothetical protein
MLYYSTANCSTNPIGVSFLWRTDTNPIGFLSLQRTDTNPIGFHWVSLWTTDTNPIGFFLCKDWHQPNWVSILRRTEINPIGFLFCRELILTQLSFFAKNSSLRVEVWGFRGFAGVITWLRWWCWCSCNKQTCWWWWSCYKRTNKPTNTAYETCKAHHDFVVIEGTSLKGVGDDTVMLNAKIAQTLGASALLVTDAGTLT